MIFFDVLPDWGIWAERLAICANSELPGKLRLMAFSVAMELVSLGSVPSMQVLDRDLLRNSRTRIARNAVGAEHVLQ